MNRVYPVGLKALLDNTLPGLVYKAILLRPGATYTTGQATIASLLPWQITATGYAPSAALGPLSVEILGDTLHLDLDQEAVWAALGGASNDTIGALVVYNEAGVLADSIPLCWIDEVQGVPGLPLTTDGGELRIGPIQIAALKV